MRPRLFAVLAYVPVAFIAVVALLLPLESALGAPVGELRRLAFSCVAIVSATIFIYVGHAARWCPENAWVRTGWVLSILLFPYLQMPRYYHRYIRPTGGKADRRL